jgi:hypothetical protein
MRRRGKQASSALEPTVLRASTLQLNAAGFTDFYRTLVGLRFPLPVDEVLELRSLINHAVDHYRVPTLTPDVRQFREALEAAIDSFGVTKKHHRERLINSLCLIRDLHVTHSINSRDQEQSLRSRLDKNQRTRTRAAREALLSVLLLVLMGFLWFTLAERHWLLLGVGALSAYTGWNRFFALPDLDEDAQVMRQQLNAVLRARVKSVNWKTLIHKLAFILGFKRVHGIEVFRVEHRDDRHSGDPTYH